LRKCDFWKRGARETEPERLQCSAPAQNKIPHLPLHIHVQIDSGKLLQENYQNLCTS
jgi:hypothetical protein